MKRLLIFLLLGPLLGCWVALALVGSPELSITAVVITTVILLPYIYLVGAGPALLVAMLDVELERRHVRGRILISALAGYIASYAAFLFGAAWARDGPEILLWGISGLVAAAACSWLSSRRNV